MNEIENQAAPAEVAEDRMVHDLMDAILQEVKVLERPWPALSEDSQRDVIERAEKRVRRAVTDAVRIIAADGRETVRAEVDSVLFKDGAKVVLKASAHSAGIHAIADEQGRDVMIVLPKAEELAEQPHEHEPEPDQASLGIDAQGEFEGADLPLNEAEEAA